jgi:inositol 1,4,5-triphosphate receptor type 1/inositol 1,4,5-triphosphate receptor type 3
VVALLGVLFVFAFSVIAFNSYFDDIYPQVTSEETCDSIITCMITLITSDVIGNSMTQWDPLKFFFDMMYTVFFGLLFTNIISGIMIDTFAELRDQRQKIEDDMKNFCFICGIERATLEKNNISFEEHTNH